MKGVEDDGSGSQDATLVDQERDDAGDEGSGEVEHVGAPDPYPDVPTHSEDGHMYSDYERLRLHNINEVKRREMELGLADAAKALFPDTRRKSKPRSKKAPVPPQAPRRSPRGV